MRKRRAVLRAFDRLYRTICRLREPDGCAWDRQQTPYSLRQSLLEECLEAISAINEAHTAGMKEELGDLYLVLTMIVRTCEEESLFSLESVLEGITAKIIRRHPHVFENRKDATVGEILTRWEQIKRQEKDGSPAESALDGVSKTLPPMEKAYYLQKAARKVGFDWNDPRPVWRKLEEEIAEIKAAVAEGGEREIEGELGDLLFTAVNLTRLLGVDPSLALHSCNEKFLRRFREMEERMRRDGKTPDASTLQEMDGYWEEIKKSEGRGT